MRKYIKGKNERMVKEKGQQEETDVENILREVLNRSCCGSGTER